MAGKAVYRKLASQFGADAAKSYLYGEQHSQQAFSKGLGNFDIATKITRYYFSQKRLKSLENKLNKEASKTGNKFMSFAEWFKKETGEYPVEF